MSFDELEHEDEIDDDIADDLMSTWTGAGITGAYHWDPGFVEASVQSYSTEVGIAEATLTETIVAFGSAQSVSTWVDIAPLIGIKARRLEECVGSLCLEEDWDSLMFALRLRAWIVPGSTELTLQGRVSEFDPTASVGLHQRIVAPEHRVGVTYTYEEDFAQYELAYTYRWP